MATALSRLRATRIRAWVRDLGAHGACANARTELERRSAEHALLDALEQRVPGDVTARPEAA